MNCASFMAQAYHLATEPVIMRTSWEWFVGNLEIETAEDCLDFVFATRPPRLNEDPCIVFRANCILNIARRPFMPA